MKTKMVTEMHRKTSLNSCHKSIRTLRPKRACALATAAGSAVMSLSGSLVHAATDTWTNTGSNSANWFDTTNWAGGAVPGATSGTTNADTALFNSAVGTYGTTGTPITIDSGGRNIGSISFDTAAGSYFIGTTSGNSLLLSSGGAVQILSTFAGTSTTQTINAPLTIEPGSPTTIGTYSFTNNSGDATNVLSFGGNITGGTTSFINPSDAAPDGGSIVLSLAGANTGLNTISGLISDGGAQTGVIQAGLAIRKTGAGTWYLTNNSNTYSGETEISQGILNVSSFSNYGVASAIGDRASGQDVNNNIANGGGIGILINGGTLQYTGSTPQSTNRQIRLGLGTNSIDASGTGNGTLSFTYSGANANLFQSTTSPNLTLTGSNTGNNTFGIGLTNGVSLVKSGVGTWVLSGNSTNTGSTTISAGTLRLNSQTIGTASYATASSYTFSPAASDLISGLTPVTDTNNGSAGAEGSGNTTVLTNGNITASNANRYTVSNGEVITYALPASSTGYNLSKINLYSNWADAGRSDIQISSISYSTIANPTTFITIPNSSLNYVPGTGTGLATLTAAGGALAVGAADLRFTFANPQENNYVGYGELEVVGVASTTGLSSSTPVSIASGANFDLNGNVQTIVSLSNSGGGGGTILNSASVPASLIINPGSGATTFSGSISDTGGNNAISITKSGAGTQGLAGANSYSGTTTMNGGTLNITGTNTGGGPLLLNSGSGTVNINSSGNVAVSTVAWAANSNAGTLNLVGGTLLESGNAVDNGGATGNSLNFAGGTLKSAAPFTISGALPINFTGAATIDTTGGNITITPGLAYTSSSGNGTFTVKGGNTLTASLNLNDPWTGNTVVTGNGTVFQDNLVNGVGMSGGTATTGDFAVGVGATLVDLQNSTTTTYSGTITGPGGFTLFGPGTLKLAGTISGTPLSIAGGGVLDMVGVSQNVASIANVASVGGSVINSAASTPVTLTLSPTGGTTKFSGSIGADTSSNAISLIMNGGGSTQVLAGANTYHGSTSVQAGTLQLAPSQAIHLTLNGMLSDASLNSNTGIFNTSGNLTPTYSVGIHGQAINLSSASNQYISVNNSPNLNISGSYTVSLWEDPSGTQQSNATLISTRNNGESTFDMQVTSTGVHSDLGNGNSFFNTSADGTATISGGWHMVTEVVSPAGYNIYIDGNSIGNGTISGQTPVFMKSGEFLTIGANEQGQGAGGLANTYFNGAIEEVNVFDTALTAAQITGLYSFTEPTTLPLNTPLTVASGASLDLGGTSETVSTLSNSAGAGGSVINSAASTPVTLTIAPTGGTTTFSGVVGGDTSSNPISIVMNGNGTQILAGLNTYLGSTTISAGTLQAGSTSAFGNNSAMTLANVSGAVLALNGFSNQIGSLSGGGTSGGNVTLGSATLTIAQTAATTFAGAISSSGGGVTLNGGAGLLALTGANSYSGPTTISAGTLIVSGSGSINNSSGITIQGSSATFVQNSSVASTPAISVVQGTLNGTGTVGNVTVSSFVGNTVTNQIGSGSGVLTVNNTLSFSGNGTLGIFIPGGATTTAGIATTTFTTANTGSGEIVVNVTPTSAWALGTTTYNLVSFTSLSGNLSDFTKGTIGLLTSRESATLGLTASDLTLTIAADAPKWTGLDSTSWQAGTTGSNHNWQLITAGTPTDYIDGDSVLFDDSASTAVTPGLVNISAGDVSPTTVTFNNSVINYTLTSTSGVIAGGGSLTKNGTASLTINTANTYSGGTTVNAGTMTIGTGGALGATTGALAVNNPNSGAGTAVLLNLSTSSPTTIGSLSGTIATPSSGTNTATIDNGGQLFTVNQTTPATFAGSIVDTGGFALGSLATSSLTLSGQSTYSGPTTISAGTLAAGVSSVPGVSGAFGNNSAVTLANVSGATLAVNSGINAQIGSLNGGGASGGNVVIASGGTLTDALTSPTTYAGVISGSGGLTLNGTGGILALSGVNTYSGPTIVSAGTLNLTGTIGSGTGSAITVYDTLTEGSLGVIAAGGSSLTIAGGTSTLSGINAYYGSTIISGGTLQPGAANVFSPNSPVVFGNVTNSVLNLNGFNEIIGSLGGGGTLGGTVSLGNNTLTVGILSTPSTFAGAITGSGTLAMTGPGSLTIASPQSFGSTSAAAFATSVILNGGTLNVANPSALGITGGTVSINAAATLEISTDSGIGVAGNPLYNIYLGNNLNSGTLPFAGTIELNRLTPGATSGITQNFNTLTMSLYGGHAGTINVTAGPNAPIGGALDTVAFGSLVFGNGNAVTETLNPTGGNIQIGNATIVAGPGSSFTDVLDLDGTTAGNQITGAITNTVNGANVATAAIVKSNTSTWTLSGPSSYTGSTTVNAGTLNFAGSNSGPSAITVAAGILNIQSSAGTYNLGTNTFIVGQATGGGTVNQSGGTVTITGGTALIVGNSVGTSSYAGAYNLSGGNLTMTGLGNNRGVIIGTNAGANGTFTLSGTGNLSVSGGTLEIGRYDVTGAGNTTDSFTQSSGTASVSNLSMGGPAGQANDNVNATLSISGGTFSAGTILAVSAAQNDVSTITIAGSAQVTLGAFPTVRGTGATSTITFDSSAGGYLSPAASNTAYLGNFTNAYLTTNGANFNVPGNISIAVAQAFQDLTSGGVLTKTGLGSLALSGGSIYTGGTNVNAGTVIAGASTSVNTNGPFGLTDGVSTGVVTVGAAAGNASASVLTGGVFTVANPIIAAAGSSGTLSIGGNTDNNSTFSGPITLNNHLTVSQVANTGSNALSITGGITGGTSGPQTVTIAGPGNINVSSTAIADGSGNNTTAVAVTGGTTTFSNGLQMTYSGGTTVTVGTLVLQGDHAGDGSGQIRGTLTVNTGGTLNAGTAWALGYGGNYVNNIAINGGTLQFGTTAGQGGTAASTISMAGGTISATGGTGFDLYAGTPGNATFTINSGSGPSTISANMNLRLSGNYVNFNVGADETPGVPEMLVSGNIMSSAGDGLVKTGAGTLQLSGSNVYSGTTYVNAGTLRTTNFSGPAVVGIGSGNVTSGTIAVGGNATTAGTLASANGQTWQNGGAYLWKITGAVNGIGNGTVAKGSGASGAMGGGTGVEGTDWDLNNVTAGTLNLSGITSANPFVIAPTGNITSGGQSYSWVIAQTSGSNTISLPTNPATSNPYATNQDMTNGGSGGAFVLNTSGLNDTSNSPLNASEFSLEAVVLGGHEDLVLDYSGTPEPGTAILVLGGAVPMLMERRRRSKKRDVRNWE